MKMILKILAPGNLDVKVVINNETKDNTTIGTSGANKNPRIKYITVKKCDITKIEIPKCNRCDEDNGCDINH